MTKRKNPAAVALGRKGGKARVKQLSAAELKQQMSALGKKSAAKRWGKKNGKA